jgi:membrane-bound lytic murein transglycosylase D
MRQVLREEGLPEDLVYLPIIESGFSSSAHSVASAVGYWQFIRATGKRYDLRIDPYVDERMDPVDSTRAAARYLKALYNLFGDWYLALASYNTGENRVKRLVMKFGTRDYWQLSKHRQLPRETREYVPKYLAAVIIAKHPEKHGFAKVDYMEAISYDSIPVFKPISLEKLSNNIGKPFEEIKKLNPKFRTDFVPVQNGETVYVRVPKGLAQQAVAALDASFSEAPKYVPNDIYYYRVRRGDTLSVIAQRNRTTVATIRRLNNMGHRSFLRVGQRLKVPDRLNYGRMVAVTEVKEMSGEKAELTTAKSAEAPSFHTVRRGENLSLIAEKYGLSVSQLMKLNKLNNRSVLSIGQKIKIKEVVEEKNGINGAESAKYHKIKSGENLVAIASKYGLRIEQLKNWNQIQNNNLIKVGQNLKLYSPKAKVHIVKRGENLSTIADAYRVSIAEIKKENELRNSSMLAVGKKLVIPQ